MINYLYRTLERKSVYWWEPRDGVPNVGDYLSYIIVKRVLELEDLSLIEKKSPGKLMAIGSVLHFAKNGDSVWGTGINKKLPDEVNKFSSLDVRAVRGPKTRDYLIQRGIECPEVYGDPGILTSSFYPESLFMVSDEKKDFIVIPHMNDNIELYKNYKDFLCSPRQYPMAFIKQLLNAKLVVSSSLHGIIMAESYGIPAIFYDSGSGESKFKYDDYYNGTGRDNYPVANSIEEALSTRPPILPDVKIISERLLKAFPFDLWK